MDGNLFRWPNTCLGSVVQVSTCSHFGLKVGTTVEKVQWLIGAECTSSATTQQGLLSVDVTLFVGVSSLVAVV